MPGWRVGSTLQACLVHAIYLGIQQDTSLKENEDGIGQIISTPAKKEKSHEVEGEGEAGASKKQSLSEGHCQECLSATESLSGNPTTPEPLPTTEGTTTPSVPPRRNPWAACNHSTPEMEGKVAVALTEFALNFYKKATEFEKDSNIVFSPISISVILSNLLLGKGIFAILLGKGIYLTAEAMRPLHMLTFFPAWW